MENEEFQILRRILKNKKMLNFNENSQSTVKYENEKIMKGNRENEIVTRKQFRDIRKVIIYDKKQEKEIVKIILRND